MAWWTDLLINVPTLAVAHERLKLAEEQGALQDRTITDLRKQLDLVTKRCNDVEAKLKQRDSAEEFAKHNGVLWLKSGAAYEDCPYCPKCKDAMHPFPPVGMGMLWMCSQCDFKVKHCGPPAA